ncbi:hypothetical protein [Paenibacillus pini]|uniref:Uncharacterized protein n=1 Tax=Paenibacillus pini JCM 16418 TaxID=1236976 RepID=W7YPQ5_9BACL|nr:hypothetical protein [Paenibacillus pini]GAF10492.1 hypothetical protein JCM16418_4701 [Paenibacillus pini JCM 16418]
MRARKFILRFLLTVVVLVIIIAGVVIWYISPQQDLNLNYTNVNVKNKAVEMLKTRKPEIHLNGAELNQFAKKELVKHLSDIPEQIQLTGAEFHFSGQEVVADLNGKWGWIPFGAELTFHMETDGELLIMEHKSTRIKNLNIPASTFGMKDMTISLKDYLPEMLDVQQIEFQEDGVKLTFVIDWLLLPSLLLK